MLTCCKLRRFTFNSIHLQLVLKCMLSCECKPRALHYILLTDTIDVAVDDTPCTLLLILLHCVSVVWSYMFATAVVLCYALCCDGSPYKSPNSAYLILPLQCITTAMHAFWLTYTLVVPMTAHHTSILMLFPLMNRKFSHTYASITHQAVVRGTTAVRTFIFNNCLHCRRSPPLLHSWQPTSTTAMPANCVGHWRCTLTHKHNSASNYCSALLMPPA
jgi:hypothetical protein